MLTQLSVPDADLEMGRGGGESSTPLDKGGGQSPKKGGAPLDPPLALNNPGPMV